MKMRKFFSFFGASALVLLSSFSCFGQGTGFEAIPAALQQQDSVLQEKVFLHTDKNTYLAGEVVWFKVYNVSAATHQALDISKVAYVEVLDKEQVPVLQGKIALENGRGNGSFNLPPSLHSGSYVIRAYTNWMKNFSPELFFVKPLTIINTFKPLGLEPKSIAAAYDVQFFPEGGHLVNNLPATVAVKAADANGKGVDFAGAVLNQANDTVASFQTLKFGMGRFSFVPKLGEKYRAVLRGGEGQIITRDLPASLPKGATMQLVSDGADKLRLTVYTSAEAAELSMVYLLVHTRGEVKVAEAKPTDVAGQVQFSIPKAAVGEGVSHFTIFNAAKQPVCERLYFKKPTDLLQVNAATDQARYSTRAKVDLSVKIRSSSGKDQAADLSVAVFRLDSLNSNPQQSIESYLWLTSELKGTIESPDFYFSSKASEQMLDNLMLTHGWSRFKWDELLQPKADAFKYVPEYGGHLVQAVLRDSRTRQPAANIQAYLASPSRTTRLHTSRSDQNGELLFDLKDFYGLQTLVAQTDLRRDSTYRIELLSPFSTAKSTYRFPHFQVPETLREQLQASNIHVQVQNYHTPYLGYKVITAAHDSTAFYGQADKTYLLDDYTRFPVMEEVMREYVLPVIVRKRQGRFHFFVVDQPRKVLFEDQPLILLDGVPVFNTDRIMAFDPRKVQRLEVVSRRYYLGSSVFNGVLSYTTYAGDMQGFEVDAKALMQEYEGLQEQREFYSPAYATPEQHSSRRPDLRTTLYWNPKVLTAADGKQSLQFYTSDQLGSYMLVVYGLTDDGKSGTAIHTFEVKQESVL